MQCPKCQHEQCNVVDSRAVEGLKRRRRECAGCGFRFSTIEYLTDETPSDIEQRVKREILQRVEEAIYER